MSFLRIFGFLFLLYSSLHATDLNVIEKKIRVFGTESTVFALSQPDGTLGIRTSKGQPFDVRLNNKLAVPTSVHWHGLILPNNQDGVAFITQYPLYPDQSYTYRFPLVQSGTFWMHSHVGLQEQKLLSAPLIISDPDDKKIADQEVILLLTDFSFKPPSMILEELRCKNKSNKNTKMSSADIVEVEYDAFLTNYRTLADPEIVVVNPNKKIRLRIINGASATNFFINLGDLIGEAIAVDGNRIKLLKGSKFELAVAQRLDIVITIPTHGTYFPILAQGEGTDKQTGLILATQQAKNIQVSAIAPEKAGAFSNDQEKKLRALNPLPVKEVGKQLFVELGGNMMNYVWTINGQAWPESTPFIIEKGQRVEMIFKNRTHMSHPMHLHGHTFQVTSIDGVPLEGALRDTILVMPNSTVAVQFDANNPGIWPLHCHILYHMEAGMFTVVRYAGFQQPL